MVQASDALHFLWNKLIGRTVIAPTISPSKTVEGFLGGVASSALLGAAFWWATPFPPWDAAGMALLISIMGFAGGMTMSAIKRDRGVKDYGTLVEGHGGVLDRIDSLCFAAPVFFHVTRLWLSLTKP
jgi:phosphatidate cytidylyltransferase